MQMVLGFHGRSSCTLGSKPRSAAQTHHPRPRSASLGRDRQTQAEIGKPKPPNQPPRFQPANPSPFPASTENPKFAVSCFNRKPKEKREHKEKKGKGKEEREKIVANEKKGKK
jgi:hypothetical protein